MNLTKKYTQRTRQHKKEWQEAFLSGDVRFYRYGAQTYGCGAVFAGEDIKHHSELLTRSLVVRAVVNYEGDKTTTTKEQKFDKRTAIYLSEFAAAILALETSKPGSNIKLHTRNNAVYAYFKKRLEQESEPPLRVYDDAELAIALLGDRLPEAIERHNNIMIHDVYGWKAHDYPNASYYMDIARQLSLIGREKNVNAADKTRFNHPQHPSDLEIITGYPKPEKMLIHITNEPFSHRPIPDHDSRDALEIIGEEESDAKLGLIEGWEADADNPNLIPE